MPLLEVVGKAGIIAPEHIGPTCVNVGFIGLQKVYPAKLAVPFGVLTLTLPLAPLPTIAVIEVEFTTVNEAAAVPPKLTVVAPVKLVPVIVTVVPAALVVGVNDVIVGVLKLGAFL